MKKAVSLWLWGVAVIGWAVAAPAPTPVKAPAPNPFEAFGEPQPRNEIDRLVFRKWRELGIQPARPCTDPVFLRRVYLDVTGTLPTVEEAQKFLFDRSADKRERLIDQLLDREEYADYWAMKWYDLLRVKSEFPIRLWPNAVQAYARWIRESIHQNKPYDQFARELLTASGSNFRVPPVNFYRAVQSKDPESLAQTVALTFMGVRADKWPRERLVGMAAFFSKVGYKSTAEWKEEIVFFDPVKTNTAVATFPDGTVAALGPDQDPRQVFADWLIRPENPWFARNIVNRLWAWVMGRGIIHEPDDIRPDNPPSNPELLAYLEKELVRAKYDLKHLLRLILNSQVYQLSPIRRSDKPEAEAQFAFYLPRRLEAEVLIDVLNQISGTTEKYTSAVPEPFTFIPEDQRAVALADGSISSSFLEMFGRPSRDTGLFAERSNRPTAAQALHLLNSSHVQRKIEQGPRLRAIYRSRAKPEQIVTRLYLTFLSRYPTAQELDILKRYASSGPARGEAALVDVAWALVNSAEFLYRH